MSSFFIENSSFFIRHDQLELDIEDGKFILPSLHKYNKSCIVTIEHQELEEKLSSTIVSTKCFASKAEINGTFKALHSSDNDLKNTFLCSSFNSKFSATSGLSCVEVYKKYRLETL